MSTYYGDKRKVPIITIKKLVFSSRNSKNIIFNIISVKFNIKKS